MSQTWVSVGRVDDIPQLGSRVVRTAKGEIALFRDGGDAVFALKNACPHKGGPLSEGIVSKGRVACPLHNWVIDLATGEAVAPDEGCAGHIPVKIDGGVVSLGL